MNGTEQGISRRGFISGAAAAASIAAFAGMAGCAPKSIEANQAQAPMEGGAEVVSDAWKIEDLGEPKETLTCDLCVVGGGGTGLAAAIEAKQLGIDVLLLEKKSQTGGSFIGSEGLFAVGSHWQEEAGIDYSQDELIENCLDYHHWIANPALYKNFFKHTAGTVTWLEDLGVEFDHVQSLGDSPNAWHVYKGIGSEGTGVTFMKSFGAAAEAAGVPMELSCSGKKVIMEDGKVSGVLAVRDNGDVVKIDCKAVIVGTGGWANSAELIRELNGSDPARVTASGLDGRDGDGLKMVKDAGGAFALGAGTMATYGPILPQTTYGTNLQAATSLEPHLWVNQDGERFVREDMFLKNFAYAGNAVHNQKRAFTVCNEAIIKQYTEVGGDVGVGVYVVAGQPMSDLADEFPKLLSSGNKYVYQADSIEELAKAMGIDAASLKKTVDEYNGMCAAGSDTEFFKPSEYMRPIEAGPYYAFEVFNGYFCTVGGVSVTPNTEVMDAERNVIPGLFAGGCDAGGLYGDTYDVAFCPGLCASWAINSGRLAAKQAARFMGMTVDDDK
ncbi:FAD-dependent oxidoreductase [Slackia exigua]|uniref:FAD-dependent oxidoreductase n=1 Tax=Slackia exigua TaxID=84109 RepID=UPI0028ED5A60|nr:FAD-dependent oxidoreductase [Slackia exigua]